MGRRWGQHFLRDEAVARRIVARSGLTRGEVALEIGPGTGRLTRALLDLADRVLAVEIDPVLAAALPGAVPDPGRLTVVEADAAAVELGPLLDEHLGPTRRPRVVASLPYDSATVILDRLLGIAHRLLGITAVVQREVADRITATPGSRSYGYLSVLCQDVAEPRRVLTLPPGAFDPPPEVHSALVRLELRRRPRRGPVSAAALRRVTGRLFEHRRKTVANNLRAAAPLPGGGGEAAAGRRRDAGPAAPGAHRGGVRGAGGATDRRRRRSWAIIRRPSGPWRRPACPPPIPTPCASSPSAASASSA